MPACLITHVAPYGDRGADYTGNTNRIEAATFGILAFVFLHHIVQNTHALSAQQMHRLTVDRISSTPAQSGRSGAGTMGAFGKFIL